jgi:hypothetical protein
MIRRCSHRLGSAFIALIGSLFVLWALGALWYDLPVSILVKRAACLAFLLCVLFLLIKTKGWAKVAALVPAVLVAAWWFSLKPSGERDWLPDVAVSAWAEVKGDEIVLHNVRNNDYRTETDYTPRWETRTVRLSRITGIDLAVNYWGSPYMAHPIVSFQFSDSPPVCFSIETRKEKGESYSAIGGIYRQYELIYIVADERDVVRVRTNFRKGEDVYLYRLQISPERARGRFMDYVKALNDLKEHPRWYNAITTNCTTSIRTQHHSATKIPWDWRMLVNGKADEMMYEKGHFLTGGLTFPELKTHSLIDKAAIAAGESPEFSKRIRTDLPAFNDSRKSAMPKP